MLSCFGGELSGRVHVCIFTIFNKFLGAYLIMFDFGIGIAHVA